MRINDIETYLDEYKLIYLIGKNGVGKTYYLKRLLNNSNKNALLIDEHGISSSKYPRDKVKIRDNKYIYNNEKYRGVSNKGEYTEDSILQKSNNVINFVKQSLSSRIADDKKILLVE